MILPATVESIDRAAHALRAGELVVMPTETVYGLAADAAQREAVDAIYTLKGRPAGHPLIVHVPDLAQARRWARFDARAERLAEQFWPGPLTLILPRQPDAPAWACGEESTIGLRCPSHPVALALLERFVELGGSGVAAPSANRFGKVSPTAAEHVLDDLGAQAPLVLEGGPCEVGVESTIVDLSRERAALLRPGRIRQADIEAVLGEPLAARDAHSPRASGTLAAHYSPQAPLEVVPEAQLETRLQVCEAADLSVGVWSPEPPTLETRGTGMRHWLGTSSVGAEWEGDLYAALREFDRLRVDRILVAAPPTGPEWDAVHDRLARAAAAAVEPRAAAAGVPTAPNRI